MSRFSIVATPLAVAVLASAGCARAGPVELDMNGIAEAYVKLVLAVGQHDPAYVDAYYGPPEWKADAEARKAAAPRRSRPKRAGSSIALARRRNGPADELTSLRHQYLRRQLESMRVRTVMLSGMTLTFDEESRGLYDAVAPVHPEAYFQGTLDELAALLPGAGPLVDRLERFRSGFVIPPDRLDAVFDLAIAECRRRTLPHAALPSDERFTVEYVT